MTRLRSFVADPRTPGAIFAGAAALSAVVLIALISRLTFFIDDWEVLLHRRGFTLDDFFVPHAGHPSMSLVAIYKAIQATLGMSSIVPYAIVAVGAFILSVVLLFIWVRRRVGDWLALAGCLPILFLGAAFEDLLTPFQLGYFAPVCCGIGALLCLERRDRRGDIAACALLVFGLTFQTLGLIFVAGAAVVVAVERDLRSRWWIAVIPAFAYVLWYAGWHDPQADQFSFDNLATSPAFVIDGYASSLGSLLGVGRIEPGGSTLSSLGLGRPLLALGVVIAVAWLLGRRRLPDWFWVVLAIGIAWWFLTALNATMYRAATTSRYQYVGAVVAVMMIAAIAQGWRPRWPVIAAVLAVAVASVMSNLSVLHAAYNAQKAAVPIVRGDLAGLEIAAQNVDPGLVLDGENSGFNYFTFVDADSYLSAADAFGSPAYTPQELASAPESGRVAADLVVATADGVALTPAPSAAGCALAQSPLTIGPGRTVIRAGAAPIDLALRRYATASYPVALGHLEAGQAGVVEVPADASEVPWTLAATGGQLESCESAATAQP